jgi:hypothetical protein
MKESNQWQMLFSFGGKLYNFNLTSNRYTDKLIVSKLQLGHVRFWVILKNEKWQFIGDMPLCQELKNIIIEKITNFHELPTNSPTALIAQKDPVRTRILLNAVLSAMALKT